MAKPQDVPAGAGQLYAGVALNLVTYIVAMAHFIDFSVAILYVAIDLACLGLFFYLGLMLVGRLSRFAQSYGALCGASGILHLVAIVLLQLIAVPEGESVGGLSNFVDILLTVWSLSLAGHVLRHTFSMSMFASIAIAVVYSVFIMTVFEWLFPDKSIVDQLSMLLPEMGYLLSNA